MDCEVFVVYGNFFDVFMCIYPLLLFVVMLSYISVFYSVSADSGGPCSQGGGLRYCLHGVKIY